MANGLSPSPQGGPPPAPNPQGGNALQGPPGAGPAAAGPGPQAQPPAPSHQQTVAALRHFHAIEKELTELLKDPATGKSDMKSRIIDGTTKLVSAGILSPGEAVQELSAVPERPFEQRQWLEQQFVNTIMASNMLLEQHRRAFAGQPEEAEPGSPDDHQTHMSSLANQYGGRNG